MKRLLGYYAAFILLTCIPVAMATTLPYFTGAAGSNPVTLPVAQNDLNALVGSINTNLQIPTSMTTAANGSVATTLGSLGPTGSHTTVQAWLQFTDASGNIRWVPAF
jgi:hypothetical protein